MSTVIILYNTQLFRVFFRQCLPYKDHFNWKRAKTPADFIGSKILSTMGVYRQDGMSFTSHIFVTSFRLTLFCDIRHACEHERILVRSNEKRNPEEAEKYV